MKQKRYQLQKYVKYAPEPRIDVRGAAQWLLSERWETIMVSDDLDYLENQMIYCVPRSLYRIVDTEKTE